MIQQEFEFFPNPTFVRYKFRRSINDESEHAREPCVPNNNEERSK